MQGRAWHRVLLIFSFLGWVQMTGQTTVIVQSLPENTPLEDGIYMSGDFENWSGGQEAYKLETFGDQYLIDLPAVEQDIAFKFTRGNWNTVEVGADGSTIANRELSLTKKTDTVRIEIQAWGDLTAKTSTASENVKLLSAGFDMGTLQKQRKILIYLPKSYDQSNKSYPVLYMHDGQNLFDKATSYTGEWEVDETLDRLSESGGPELIVIGIDHGGQDRIDEYTPYKLSSYESKVLGHDYMRFIVEELKPYVDQNYRTMPAREHTGVMGSSLGGLISFYAAMEWEDTFGLAGVFSPSFELIDESIPAEEIVSPLSDTRMYMMCGNRESGHMVPAMRQMARQMTEIGFKPENLHIKVIEGGKHNEELWRKDFENAVSWLYKNMK